MPQLYTISNLRKIYQKKPVLEITNLRIDEGEIIGLIGANGSEKSTLLRHLALLESSEKGELLYKGESTDSISLNKKREISILLPEPYLLKRSVRENLLYGLKVRGEKLDKTTLEERLDEALTLVGLQSSKFLHRAWHELSSGETQRVAFASRLMLRPKTLLLDEPTNSLDFSGIPQFSKAILHAHKEWGTTVIIASHDLVWLSQLATRQIGLHFGRLMEFSSENLILGEWERCDSRLVYHFSDSQKISLPNTHKIGPKRGIAINPRALKISQKEPTREESKITLKARISSVSHLKQSDEIALKLSIGAQTLEAIMDMEKFKSAPMLPACEVFISIDENEIKTPWSDG
ncbi:MAG: energy-coupling factor ABC transporter ATP-binding protein [Wolinella sp.]